MADVSSPTGVAVKPASLASAWQDGAFVDRSSVALPMVSAGLRYGVVLFDGCRVWVAPTGTRARILALERHLARFQQSCALCHLPCSTDTDSLRRIVIDVVRANAPSISCSLRLFAALTGRFLLDDGPVNLSVMLLEDQVTPVPGGLTVALASVPRGDGGIPRQVKSTAHYAAARLTMIDAKQRGCHEVLFHNERGHVTEASRANLVIVEGRTFVTPPAADGALAGVTLSIVRDVIAPRLGYQWEERSVTPERLRVADAAMLTSSSIGIVPIRSLDGRTYPIHVPEHVQHAYAAFGSGREDPPGLDIVDVPYESGQSR